MSAIYRAIEAAGGATRLASALGVKVNVVTNWRARGTAPAEQVLAIESATGVSRHDLRPDVFGPANEGEAGEVPRAA